MVIQRADFRPLYKPMNSLAEKGYFVLPKWRELTDGSMNAGLLEKIHFFPDSCAEVRAAALFRQNPAPLFRGV